MSSDKKQMQACDEYGKFHEALKETSNIHMRRFLFFLLSLSAFYSEAQVFFSESFNSLVLNSTSYTVQTTPGVNTVTTTYTTVPSAFAVINDGYMNNPGTLVSPNKPFNITALNFEGWAIAYNPVVNDTFLVSTSWLDTTGNAVKRYVVTPTFSNVTANTIVSWEAMSPDPTYREGYQVLVTTNTTGTLSAMDFTSIPVFSLLDGNTSGGGEKSTWTKHGVSLASYAGQNIRIAFKDISKDMYQLWIDDIRAENVSYTVDAEVTAGKPIYKYNKINTNGNVGCRVTNRGVNTINSFTLNYSIGGGTPQSQAFNISLPPYASIDLPMNTPYNISTPGYYTVKLWVSNINGTPDPNKANDTLHSAITIVSSAPSKSVMIEQFLSANDGYSPDAQEKLRSLAQSTTNLIQVNIHEGDSMYLTSMSSLFSDYRPANSTAFIDRNYFYDINSVPIDRFNYPTRFAQRSGTVVPVSVSISNMNYNSTTRVIDFTVQASFTGEVKGDYRFNAYLTENNVYGPPSSVLNGWNQLSFMYNTPWSPYYQTGSYDASMNGYVLDPFEYKQNWVLDAALDGVYGVSGIIPSNGGTDGQTFSRAYSYTISLPANGEFRFTPDNMYLVAYVAEYDTDKNSRTILNSTQQKMTFSSEIVGVKTISPEAGFSVYPNPSNGNLTLFIPENEKYTLLKIYDVLGNLVYSNDKIQTGKQKLILFLENGSYLLVIDGEKRYSRKLIISR